MIDRMRAAPLEQHIGFGAHDEEGRLQREAIRPLEVDIGTIYHIKRASLRQELIEHIYVRHFAVGDVNKGGDVAAQIEQSMHLHSGFVPAEPGPVAREWWDLRTCTTFASLPPGKPDFKSFARRVPASCCCKTRHEIVLENSRTAAIWIDLMV